MLPLVCKTVKTLTESVKCFKSAHVKELVQKYNLQIIIYMFACILILSYIVNIFQFIRKPPYVHVLQLKIKNNVSPITFKDYENSFV